MFYIMVFYFYFFKNMSFESKTDWNTNINSVGGAKDAYFVTSPYSNQPSANASQGALTYGNLVTEFTPPKIIISPTEDGYYIRNRFDLDSMSSQVSDVTTTNMGNPTNNPTGITNKSSESFRKKAYVAPSRRTEKFTLNPSRKKERYTEIPGFRGSEIHQEAFTPEETNYIFVILISVIVFCLVGVCFGFLIPKVNVRVFDRNR